MSKIALQLECSVEANVPADFAWKFRTNIANWNDPPATFTMVGPFESGSHGTTLMPGQQVLHWTIRDVRRGTSFVMEMQLDGATLNFEWNFDQLPGNATRMTQRIVLFGENAGAYAAAVEAGFGANLEPGMKRIAAEMTAAANVAG